MAKSAEKSAESSTPKTQNNVRLAPELRKRVDDFIGRQKVKPSFTAFIEAAVIFFLEENDSPSKAKR